MPALLVFHSLPIFLKQETGIIAYCRSKNCNTLSMMPAEKCRLKMIVAQEWSHEERQNYNDT